jgi:hypothetical protein
MSRQELGQFSFQGKLMMVIFFTDLKIRNSCSSDYKANILDGAFLKKEQFMKFTEGRKF